MALASSCPIGGGESGEGLTCQICLSSAPPLETSTLPCSHSLCHNCAIKFFLRREFTCPTCRTEIDFDRFQDPHLVSYCRTLENPVICFRCEKASPRSEAVWCSECASLYCKSCSQIPSDPESVSKSDTHHVISHRMTPWTVSLSVDLCHSLWKVMLTQVELAEQTEPQRIDKIAHVFHQKLHPRVVAELGRKFQQSYFVNEAAGFRCGIEAYCKEAKSGLHKHLALLKALYGEGYGQDCLDLETVLHTDWGKIIKSANKLNGLLKCLYGFDDAKFESLKELFWSKNPRYFDSSQWDGIENFSDREFDQFAHNFSDFATLDVPTKKKPAAAESSSKPGQPSSPTIPYEVAVAATTQRLAQVAEGGTIPNGSRTETAEPRNEDGEVLSFLGCPLDVGGRKMGICEPVVMPDGRILVCNQIAGIYIFDEDMEMVDLVRKKRCYCDLKLALEHQILVTVASKAVVLLSCLAFSDLLFLLVRAPVSIATYHIADRSQSFRIFYLDPANHFQLGGPGRVVELDESKLYRAKYNRGRGLRRRHKWVFGLIERGSHRCVVVPVDTRDAATLLPIIQQWVRPGSTIVTDSWAAYGGIAAMQGLNYVHLQVNHRYNFINPQNAMAHTQGIESMWSNLKRQLRHLQGTSDALFQSYLYQYMWRRSMRNENIFGQMLYHIGIYNPV